MSHSVDTPASRGPAVLAVTSSTLAVCTLFVALRLISRFAIVRKPGLDDYCMVLAWLLAFGTSFAACYGTRVGLGRHEADIPPEHVVPMKKAAYAFAVLYNPALMATKTSILLFYLTLSRTQKAFRWATYATLMVVNVGGLALALLNTLQCRPLQAAWETPAPPGASCTNIITIYLSSAPLNIITDLAILFLPMPILTGLRLPKKQKIILVITFGFGIFVTIVDVVRIAYLESAAREHLNAVQDKADLGGLNSRNGNDFSWYASFTFMWSCVEINMGIMCGCVPALKPLMSRFLPQWIHDHTLREKTVTHTSESMAVHPDIATTHHGRNPSAEPPLPKPDSPLSKSGSDETMDMMAFLTTPDMDGMPRLRPSHDGIARTRAPAFYDFVETSHKKDITLMNNRESIQPILLVTILFFIWGFAYGLLDTLNGRFQQVARMTPGQTVGQHSAYYLGYLIGPLTFGRLVFRHWGFKACYTVGLGVYACGTLVFWPSAVLTSFPAFLISNFITGLGLSTLEISANPFIALCGPPEYAEARLNLSQGIQAIGTVLSPLLAKKVLFKASANSLIKVQWTYMGISFFTVALAVVYYYIPLPEATDEELEKASARLQVPREATVGNSKIKVIWITLALGVFSQFCYVGGQESTATSFTAYIEQVMPSLKAENHLTIGHTAFAISRFIAAFMNIWMKPRYILLFYYAGAIAFAAACMNGSGATPAALIVMLMFFEGPLFPMIYALPLRGMGKHTKDAAVLLTAATSGGAAFPPIMYAVMKARNLQYSFCIVVAAYAAGTLYPLYLNFYPPARMVSDPIRDDHARRESMLHRERRKDLLSSAAEKRGPGRRSLGQDVPTPELREYAPVTLPPPAQTFHEDGSEHGSGFPGGKGQSDSLDFHTAPSWFNDEKSPAHDDLEAGTDHARSESAEAEPGPSTNTNQKPRSPSPDFQTKPEWLDFATNEGSRSRSQSKDKSKSEAESENKERSNRESKDKTKIQDVDPTLGIGG